MGFYGGVDHVVLWRLHFSHVTDHVTRVSALLVPPSRPEVEKLSDSSVKLTWSVAQGGLAITFFKVRHSLTHTHTHSHTRTHKHMHVRTHTHLFSISCGQVIVVTHRQTHTHTHTHTHAHTHTHTSTSKILMHTMRHTFVHRRTRARTSFTAREICTSPASTQLSARCVLHSAACICERFLCLWLQIQYKDLTAPDRRSKGWKTIDEDIAPHQTQYEVAGLRPGQYLNRAGFRPGQYRGQGGAEARSVPGSGRG